jgi:hypothetical protein
VDASIAASQTTHTQTDSDMTAALTLRTRVAAAWNGASDPENGAATLEQPFPLPRS